MAIFCVGVAYFVIGVVFPLAMFLTGYYPWPEMRTNGLVFSGLAGVAGAIGAICVIFATQAARSAAVEADPARPDALKVFIAPLIFGLAPVINVVVSIFWHPEKGNAFHFGFATPHWLLWVGIILVSIGAGLVLYSKELSEAASPPPSQKTEPSATIGAAAGGPAAMLDNKLATEHQPQSKP
jgi:hypothetical protein